MAVMDDLAVSVLRLLRALADPALERFSSAWPSNVARMPAPHPLPVLRYIPQVAAAAKANREKPVRRLCRDVCRAAPLLAWRHSYAPDEVGARFLENYAWSELVGPRGPLPSTHIAGGFLLLGPQVTYPRHRHKAEEYYVPLAGLASWQQGDDVWRERPPGSLIHHRSEEGHSMQTGAQPLLALYLWCGEDVAGSSRLEGAITP